MIFEVKCHGLCYGFSTARVQMVPSTMFGAGVVCWTLFRRSSILILPPFSGTVILPSLVVFLFGGKNRQCPLLGHGQ